MALPTIRALDVEIYVGNVATLGDFDPANRGNDKTIAGYIQDQITATDITSWTKLSDGKTEFTLEPGEDTTENKNYIGANASGGQNGETQVVVNQDVDITLSADAQIVDELMDFAFQDSGITNSTYTNYTSFTLASGSSSIVLMVIRVKRLIGTEYYYETIAVFDPKFKKQGQFGISADDTAATTEYSLTGNKGSTFVDFYSGTTQEVLTDI